MSDFYSCWHVTRVDGRWIDTPLKQSNALPFPSIERNCFHGVSKHVIWDQKHYEWVIQRRRRVLARLLTWCFFRAVESHILQCQATGITTQAQNHRFDKDAHSISFRQVSGFLYNHLRNLCAIGAGLGIHFRKKTTFLRE